MSEAVSPGEIESCRACIRIAQRVPGIGYRQLAALHTVPEPVNPDLIKLRALRARIKAALHPTDR